jgi:hypothetical protein
MNNEDKQHGSSSSQPTLYCILARYNYFIFFFLTRFHDYGIEPTPYRRRIDPD